MDTCLISIYLELVRGPFQSMRLEGAYRVSSSSLAPPDDMVVCVKEAATRQTDKGKDMGHLDHGASCAGCLNWRLALSPLLRVRCARQT